MPEGENWEVIVKCNGDIGAIAEALGIQAEVLGEGFAILTLAPEDIDELYQFPEIAYIEMPRELSLSAWIGPDDSCVPPARNPLDYGLSGRGTIVGVIDSGVDYTHPAFRDADGNSRILCLWDQTAEGAPPRGFLGGVEYNNEQLNAALKSPIPFDVVPETDSVGHGTAVAGIAAGGGEEEGVAPEASLIVVRLGERGRRSFARTTEIMRALKYVSDRALEFGMPVAVNLSFGTNNGSHAGNSLFETFIDDVARRGKCVIVTATGNEGFAGHHYEGKAKEGQMIEIDFTVVSPRSVYLTMWKGFADTFDIELIAPNGGSSGIMSPSDAFRSFSVPGVDVSIYYGQPSFYNENQEIFIQLDPSGLAPQNAFWRLLVFGRKVIEGDFHIWLPTLEDAGDETFFLTSDSDLTLTIPSTARNVLSVGGYDAETGSAAPFSGRGYTFRDIYVKPDLAAPAVDIRSARAGGGYAAFTGTSMAAPFAAGAAALMMEWGIARGNDPFLYGQRVKAYLMSGASRDPSIAYPNNIWGYGALCLEASMDLLRDYGSIYPLACE
ncbi:MAG: S8 family serine peptidase [Clostridiales bacterium]|jgi:subtilisin family serine protease|nr:S8 family serine peptidase [Clostridiales bacterium]